MQTLAEIVANFKCEDASCSSEHDQRLIDGAIAEKMGNGDVRTGYKKLTTDLKDVFKTAIIEGNAYTEHALEIVTKGYDSI